MDIDKEKQNSSRRKFWVRKDDKEETHQLPYEETIKEKLMVFLHCGKEQ